VPPRPLFFPRHHHPQSLLIFSLGVFFKQSRSFKFFPAWAFCLPTTLLRLPYSLLDAFLWSGIVYWLVRGAGGACACDWCARRPCCAPAFHALRFMPCVLCLAFHALRFMPCTARPRFVAPPPPPSVPHRPPPHANHNCINARTHQAGLAPDAGRYFIFTAYLFLLHTMGVALFRLMGGLGRELNRTNMFGS
jgi:hypothetical protein